MRSVYPGLRSLNEVALILSQKRCFSNTWESTNTHIEPSSAINLGVL